MKFLLKLLFATSLGAACVYLVIKDMDAKAVGAAIGQMSMGALGLYLVTLTLTILFRAWRWEYLLRPIGVSLPMRTLMPISLVGFMAILAMPVRLGEFVRPFYVVRLGHSRMSAVLGTVAVERIVDGLLISILFFCSYMASDPGTFSPSLRFAAWLSLGGFLGLTVGLGFALRWPEPTIRFGLRISLIGRLSPSLAHKLTDKLRAVIQGFRVLSDPRNLFMFLGQSVAYWGINGIGMWILARGMGLDVSLVAAFTAMSFTGVLISLPNAPGLVGQFHLGIVTALAAYLPAATVNTAGIAYATVLHGVQLIWYCLLGVLGMWAMPRGAMSLRRAVTESNQEADEAMPAEAQA